jgi:hypothetical protein
MLVKRLWRIGLTAKRGGAWTWPDNSRSRCDGYDSQATLNRLEGASQNAALKTLS